MIWNTHLHDIPPGTHAFLSPSSNAWLRYDKDKMRMRVINRDAALRGTEDHAYAELSIRRRQKLRGNSTLTKYVNDAIGFRMTPEQPLVYDHNCFGTADAIFYDERKKFLRIHDLKTGVSPVSFDQLLVYAALFCMEYKVDPMDIKCELRIYQNNDYEVLNPAGELIENYMDIIVERSKWVDEITAQEL